MHSAWEGTTIPCTMFHALMRVCTQSVSRDVRIHTLITNTCTYAVTTHTFLPFCLQVWPKRLHPSVTLHHSDDGTHIHQGFCIACLLQECMKELSLQCCIHFLPDCLLITIWYNISLLKLQCNGRCIHVCNELLTKVVKKLSCVEREESIHKHPTTWKGTRYERNDQHLHAVCGFPYIVCTLKWENNEHSTHVPTRGWAKLLFTTESIVTGIASIAMHCTDAKAMQLINNIK